MLTIIAPDARCLGVLPQESLASFEVWTLGRWMYGGEMLWGLCSKPEPPEQGEALPPEGVYEFGPSAFVTRSRALSAGNAPTGGYRSLWLKGICQYPIQSCPNTSMIRPGHITHTSCMLKVTRTILELLSHYLS